MNPPNVGPPLRACARFHLDFARPDQNSCSANTAGSFAYRSRTSSIRYTWFPLVPPETVCYTKQRIWHNKFGNNTRQLYSMSRERGIRVERSPGISDFHADFPRVNRAVRDSQPPRAHTTRCVWTHCMCAVLTRCRLGAPRPDPTDGLISHPMTNTSPELQTPNSPLDCC